MTDTQAGSDTGVLAGEERMLIDGELQFTGSGATFDVIHPASEQVAGQATDGTVEDMARAVGAARRAFDETDWSRDLDFRYHCLTQLHEAFERNKERLRRILVTEVGCPVKVTGSQIESPIAEVKHWAEYGKNFDYLVDNGVHETALGPARRKIHYEPVGVVGAITPWNVPFYLNVAETVPALMAGNTVVLKPAQLTPWSGSEYGRIVAEETDIPAGVFNVVVSNANEVGAALSSDPRVDMITFTGSTATGRAILAAGAPTVKKTLLELGGKSAHIVLDDADFGMAVSMAALMACVMSGQSCILPSRILLPRSRYDEGIEIMKTMMENFAVGDPWDPNNMQGPQISEGQRQKVLGLIKSGVDSGARLVTGGGIPEQPSISAAAPAGTRRPEPLPDISVISDGNRSLLQQQRVVDETQTKLLQQKLALREKDEALSRREAELQQSSRQLQLREAELRSGEERRAQAERERAVHDDAP